MIADDRLDGMIRAALEHHAGRAVGRQPTLQQAANRLAERLQPGSRLAGRRMAPMPASAGLVNLLTLLLLLLLGLSLALYVGARLDQPPPRRPFGFAGPCLQVTPPGGLAFDGTGNPIILEHFTGDQQLTVYADGRWVRDLSNPGETRMSTITGAQIEHRRLSPQGLELLFGRINEAGLGYGCRELTTVEASGLLTVWTPQGVIGATWGPQAGALSYRTGAEEEAALVALTHALAEPAAWLPDEAWLEPATRLRPDHWLIILELRATEHQPGDAVELPNGDVLPGSDPRFAMLELPGAIEPREFGALMPLEDLVGPGSSVRCSSVTLDEALVVARSLEAIDRSGSGPGTAEGGDLYTTDLSTSIGIGIQPAYGPAYGCQEMAADRRGFSEAMAPMTPSPEPVTGELADVNPCTLVPADAAAALEADTTRVAPSRLPLGRSAHSCVAANSAEADPSYVPQADQPPIGWRTMVTLYPLRLPRGAVPHLVESVYGEGLTERTLGDHQLWVRACEPPSDFCADAFVGWTNSRLLFFEFTAASLFVPGPDPNVFGPEQWQRIVTAELAEAFMQAVLDQAAAEAALP